MFQKVVRLLGEALPQAQLQELSGTAHVPAVTHPDLMAGDLLWFLTALVSDEPIEAARRSGGDAATRGTSSTPWRLAGRDGIGGTHDRGNAGLGVLFAALPAGPAGGPLKCLPIFRGVATESLDKVFNGV